MYLDIQNIDDTVDNQAENKSSRAGPDVVGERAGPPFREPEMNEHHTAEEPAPRTVGQLVVERPSRARVFEKFGIDYCCGGKKPLEQACRDRQVDVQVVLDELRRNDERRAAERDWAALGLTRLADHIEQAHHGYLRHELPRLDFLTHKVAAAHGQRHPELLRLRDVFAAFKAELLNHMQKEELVVFPLCRRIEAGEVDERAARGGCGGRSTC